MIYFNLDSDVIKENCKFAYYFNKTYITLTVLGGGNKIIWSNQLDKRHIIWHGNNDIPVTVLRHPYRLVMRNVLCNWRIEVENNFLLESLTALYDAESKLVMYYMVNTAFVNYLKNLTASLKFPILLNRTTHEQTWPISIHSFEFNSDLLRAPKH